MKKILIFTQFVDMNNPLLGFFVPWLRAFAERFDEVHVICFEAGEHNLPENVKVYEIGKYTGWKKVLYIPRFYITFATIFFVHRPKYVFFHMVAIFTLLSAPFYYIRKLVGSTFMLWMTHGNLGFMDRSTFRFVDHVFTAAERGYEVATSKKHVVGHGIDVNLFSPPEHKRDWNKPIKIALVGRVSPVKGIEHALRGVAPLIKKGNDLHLSIVGPKDDLKYLKELEELVKDLGVSDRVLFWDPIPNTKLPDFYGKHHIVLNTTIIDTADKVTLEAMSCGAIPVTFSSMFKDNKKLTQFGGFDVQPSTVTKRLELILELPVKDKAILSDCAREEIVEKHSLTALHDKIFSYIE